MPITASPLRYPGGKSALSSYLKALLTQNDLAGGHYVEPYAGGAGLALNLLFNGYASEIHLNDLNPAVHNFWFAALNYSADLQKLVQLTTVNIDEWHVQKERFDGNIGNDPVKHAFATLFLNRTNRSGILSAGVIGGKNQDGDYKLDARYSKDTLLAKLKKISDYQNRIHLYNLDAAELLTSTLPSLPQNTLVYFDPPYYVKGQNLYQNHYHHEDHKVIADLIQASEIPYWMVSYDNVPQIEQLYRGRRNVTYHLNYSAQIHGKGSEIIIFSDKLIVPDIENPAKVSKRFLNQHRIPSEKRPKCMISIASS